MLQTTKTTGNDYSYGMFRNFVQEHGVKIKNLDNMPEIGITRALFENPWNTDDEDLYAAKGMRLTLAKDKNGDIFALNKVSKDYRLVQHHEAIFRALEIIVNQYPEFGIPEIVLHFRNNGGRMNAEFTFPKAIELQGNDPVKPRITLSNSADLSKRFLLLFGAFRLICSNGLVIPDSRFPDHVSMKKLHKLGTLNLEECLANMADGFKSFSDTIGLWNMYNEKEIGMVEWEYVMGQSTLSDNQAKEVLQIPIIGYGDQKLDDLFQNGAKVNAWQAYNAATQWVTHNTKNEQTAMERGIAIANAFEKVLAR